VSKYISETNQECNGAYALSAAPAKAEPNSSAVRDQYSKAEST